MNQTGSESAASGSPFSMAVDAVGRFAFRYRDYLTPVAIVLGLALTHPEYPAGSERLDNWLDVLGLMVALAGQIVRVLVIGYAYIHRGGIDKRLAAPKLVCEGFFAHVRNPMYVGNMLIIAGLALVYNSRWVYLIGLPLFYGGFLAIIHAEERFLSERFGADYEAYCRRVNRFVPNLRGIRTTLAGMRFDWRRALRKDYGTAFAWLSTAIVLLAWERFQHLGFAGSEARIASLLVVYLAIVVAYVTVRRLKKQHRLRS
jgi:protein-S-isoprenylcysteine O-methyltransferase Ste14